MNPPPAVPNPQLVTRLDVLLRQPPLGLILVRPGVPPMDDIEDRMALVRPAVRATMNRIVERSADRDVIALIESDLVLLARPGLTAPAETEALARRLHTDLGQPLILDDEVIRCTITIGAAVSAPGDTGAALLGYARHALEDARALGGDRVVVFDDLGRQLLEPPDR